MFDFEEMNVMREKWYKSIRISKQYNNKISLLWETNIMGHIP